MFEISHIAIDLRVRVNINEKESNKFENIKGYLVFLMLISLFNLVRDLKKNIVIFMIEIDRKKSKFH